LAITRRISSALPPGRWPGSQHRQLEAYWRGLNPDLMLDDVRVLDAGGEPAFTLTRVESVLSWQTLWRMQPTLALLAFDSRC
jgi:uncharacterized protein YhdP